MKKWAWILAALVAGCSSSTNNSADTMVADTTADFVVPSDIPLTDRTPLDEWSDVSGELTDMVELTDLTDDVFEVGTDLMDLTGEETLADVVEVEVTPPPEPVAPQIIARTSWGGYEPLKLSEGTGFFATAVTEDRLWLVDPDGHAFFSLGIQAVSTGSLDAPALGYAPGKLAQWTNWADQFGSWGAISSARLKEHMAAMLAHGFNTVGGWSGGYGNLSGNGIAYSVSLGFAGGTQGAIPDKPIPKVSTGNFPDVFHPDFPAACAAYAASHISESQAADPWNIGYYSDNELRWWGKDYFIESGTWSLADDYIDEAADSPGKQAFVALMEERYEGDVAAFNTVYGTELVEFADLGEVTSLPYDKSNADQVDDRMAFIGAIAESYFSNVQAALKEAAPNHLYLCVRFASVAPKPVIEMAARYCDVVTFNDYYILPDPITEMALGGSPEERWAEYGAIVTANDPPRPIVVTEWGIRADDSGQPNTFGAGFVVDTQYERADFYRYSADWFLGHGANGFEFVAGWHWFMYIDEPPTGRFDGEDGNYGVTTVRDEKYHFLWQAMATINTWVDDRLVLGLEPTLLPPPDEVQVTVENGKAKLAWSEVPLATAYEVTMMTHPAGTEGRILSATSLVETATTLDLVQHGLGTYWFGVAAVSDDLLSMGPRVSEAALAEWDDPAPELDDVLACESLATVRFHNEVPTPNDEKGQTYAASGPSFIEDGGAALRMEFVPSSLGNIMLSPAGDTTLSVEVALPEPMVVAKSDALTFKALAHHLVRTDQEMAAATDFVWLTVLDPDDKPLAQFDLGTLDVAPGEPQDVVVPISEAGQAAVLRFEVDLFTPYLPLESVLRLDVDQFAFVSP